MDSQLFNRREKENHWPSIGLPLAFLQLPSSDDVKESPGQLRLEINNFSALCNDKPKATNRTLLSLTRKMGGVVFDPRKVVFELRVFRSQ